MVTAELAVALPALVMVLVTALGGLALAIDQLRCVDAARAGARAAARGDPPAAVRDVVRRIAPAGAGIDVSASVPGGLVTVRVSSPRRALGVLVPAPLQPDASAVAQREDGASTTPTAPRRGGP